MALDFEGVAAAALRAYATLLPQWVGGKRVGEEWIGDRRSKGGVGDSWSINITTGVWGHFASGARGHDIIGFYAQLKGLSQGEACIQIAEQLGMSAEDSVSSPIPATSSPESDDLPEPIPPDAPPVKAAIDRPSAIYRYGNSLVVMRFDTPEGKTFRQWTWRRGAWAPRGYGPNCPLYKLAELHAAPSAPVLIVEGEKCVHAAISALPNFAVTTWAGGVPAVKKADWSALKDRDVLIWPDADDPGRKAAAEIAQRLHKIARRVRVINPNGADPAWDVADAIAAGWDTARIQQWIDEHLVTAPKNVTPLRKPTPKKKPESDGSAPVNWASMDLESGPQGPYPTLANASKILQTHQRFKDHIWFDEFRGHIYHTLRGEVPQRWTDAETRALTVQIQQQLQLHKFTTRLVAEGLRHAAECQRRNSLTEWLDSLEWDGVPRLDTWLSDCAGVELNDYTQAVARNWLIGMVARAYKPGCKMDNMPVLEGVSGLRKTSFLELLGGQWYKALPMDFGSKDFLQALRGAWLIEIPDMAGFGRTEHTKVLAIITTAIDTYRAPYGEEPEEIPRTCVFAATSETDDYLADARGKRRYWPLACREINLEALQQQRVNLFAEAVEHYRAGATWYSMPAETTQQEQLSRVAEPDGWQEDILQAADEAWIRYKISPEGSKITAKRLLGCLDIPVGQITEAQCRRVATILRNNGWKRHRDARLGFFWLRTY